MKNAKQWAKAFMAIAIGIIPICFAGYAHATWYFVFLTFCSLFGVLGMIALFQLFIYTILFPYQRNAFVKTLYGISIIIALSIPFLWIAYNEVNPEKLLKNNFEITEASLIKSIPTADEKSYNIEYEYTVNGQQYKSTKMVEHLPKSNPFYLKYLPSKPEVNEPAE